MKIVLGSDHGGYLYKKELITLGTTNRKEYRATKSKYVTNLIERAKQYKQQKN